MHFFEALVEQNPFRKLELVCFLNQVRVEVDQVCLEKLVSLVNELRYLVPPLLVDVFDTLHQLLQLVHCHFIHELEINLFVFLLQHCRHERSHLLIILNKGSLLLLLHDLLVHIYNAISACIVLGVAKALLEDPLFSLGRHFVVVESVPLLGFPVEDEGVVVTHITWSLVDQNSVQVESVLLLVELGVLDLILHLH